MRVTSTLGTPYALTPRIVSLASGAQHWRVIRLVVTWKCIIMEIAAGEKGNHIMKPLSSTTQRIGAL